MRNQDEQGALPIEYLAINGSDPSLMSGEIVQEVLSCITVNGQEVASFMCSPIGLEELTIGFLHNENIIQGIQDVATLHQSDSHCVDVWLNHKIELPSRRIITAGCGGGVTFDDLSKEYPPLESTLTAHSDALIRLMKKLHEGAKLYLRSRGIHTAVLASEENILLQVEDVGRHNCIDKISGAALKAGISTENKILLSSGRISSEMLNKARRMKIPIVCSRTSPTSLSVALAKSWNITIVAYLRGSRMRVYTHHDRITPNNRVKQSSRSDAE